ncbi:MAG: CPBP family intramembrane glutamic endopeptidase [Saprospiraceae bacterium]
MSKNNKSFFVKLIGFIIAIFIGLFLGTIALIGSGLLGGMELEYISDIMNQMSNLSLRPYLKAGIGLNHFFTFTFSALLFAYWLNGDKWKDYFQLTPIKIDVALKYLLLLLFAYPAIISSAMLLEGLDLPEWANNMDTQSMETLQQVLAMDGIGDLFVNILIIAVLPAIGEELLFRGVIQNELVKKITNPHVAIGITAFIFSAIHLQVLGFIPKFILGLILGYSYYWTKSIWYPILLHFFNNGLQTVLLYFSGDQLDLESADLNNPNYLHIMFGIIISILMCHLVIKNIPKEKNTKA